MILLTSSLESFFQLIGVLIIFLFVLLITYLTLKWMGGYQNAHSYNKNLQIKEFIRLGNNKSIGIIACGDKYLVVALGKDEIHLLKEMTEEELKVSYDSQPTSGQMESFQEIFSKVKNSLPGNSKSK